MPSNYSGTNSWAEAIQLPSDGDLRDAASVNAAFEGLADRSHAIVGWHTVPLTDGVQWSDTYVSGGHTVPAWVPNLPGGAGGWAAAGPCLYQADVTVCYAVGFPITFPVDCNDMIVIGFRARVHGDLMGAGPHGGLPATMPVIRAGWRNLSTGVWVDGVYGPVVDTSGDVGAYESWHSIGGSLLGTPLLYCQAHNFAPWIYIEGETGVNALASSLAIGAVQYYLAPPWP